MKSTGKILYVYFFAVLALFGYLCLLVININLVKQGTVSSAVLRKTNLILKDKKEEDDDSACPVPHGIKYNLEYWQYQRRMGEFGAQIDNWKFKPYIKSTDRVLDYGCGGCYFLDQLAPNISTSMGLEVNPQAVLAGRSRGLTVKMCTEALPDDYFDVIYSHHALEHVPDAFESLSRLLKKLKRGGKAVFVTPYEHNPSVAYVEDDPNHHIWTWSPLLLGNLFASVGFKVEECSTLQNQWPQNAEKIFKEQGFEAFQKIAHYTAKQNDNYQVRCVAMRPL